MKTLNNLFIISLFLFILSACSGQPENTDIAKEKQDAVTAGPSDRDESAVIGPADANARTVITIKTNNTAISSGEIHWYVNDSEIEPSGGLHLTFDALKKGDIVKAVIVNGDKKYPSNELTIKNTPPAILKAELIPSRPVVSDILRPNVKAEDVDKDNITFKYRWTVNGVFAGEESRLQTDLKRDDKIMFEATPYDGEEYGREVRLETTVYNSLPSAVDGEPAFDGKIYSYKIPVTDPDNDSLTFELQQGPAGMTIDESAGIITWEVRPEDKGRHEIKVMVSDNHGGKIIVPITAKISLAEEQ